MSAAQSRHRDAEDENVRDAGLEMLLSHRNLEVRRWSDGQVVWQPARRVRARHTFLCQLPALVALSTAQKRISFFKCYMIDSFFPFNTKKALLLRRRSRGHARANHASPRNLTGWIRLVGHQQHLSHRLLIPTIPKPETAQSGP